jgi:hypothetical protein
VTTDWRQVFEETYAAAASPVQERVWREVFGDDYPEGVDPYSFVTRSELDRFARDLALVRARRSSTSAAAAAAPGSGWRPRPAPT